MRCNLVLFMACGPCYKHFCASKLLKKVTAFDASAVRAAGDKLARSEYRSVEGRLSVELKRTAAGANKNAAIDSRTSLENCFSEDRCTVVSASNRTGSASPYWWCTRCSWSLRNDGRCHRPTALWPPTCNWWGWWWFHHQWILTASIRGGRADSRIASSRKSLQCVEVNCFQTTASSWPIQLKCFSLSLIDRRASRCSSQLGSTAPPSECSEAIAANDLLWRKSILCASRWRPPAWEFDKYVTLVTPTWLRLLQSYHLEADRWWFGAPSVEDICQHWFWSKDHWLDNDISKKSSKELQYHSGWNQSAKDSSFKTTSSLSCKNGQIFLRPGFKGSSVQWEAAASPSLMLTEAQRVTDFNFILLIWD